MSFSLRLHRLKGSFSNFSKYRQTDYFVGEGGGRGNHSNDRIFGGFVGFVLLIVYGHFV